MACTSIPDRPAAPPHPRPPHPFDAADARAGELLDRLLHAERFGRLDEVRHVMATLAEIGGRPIMMEAGHR